MNLRVSGIPTAEFDQLRNDGFDANGQAPLARVAEGAANPCRHCLQLITPGADKLVLNCRPFPCAQPYAETGPIFLHNETCVRFEGAGLPAWFHFLDPAAVRGYDADDWIRYETGQIVRGGDLKDVCESILSDPSVAYVHIRSKFGCFQYRVDRASAAS
ncbi:DUF1203 domain-containing protein [Vitreimonas flagellata]|uniref:DUF1203 domain-containing protein n=1 Tax=Vitreimonas flagellata TaxID=2560861 RepID=UPI00107509AC|nr:DUF1203 domain-containing protein [Vitreimonas flagellata]